jgi:uncharacterized membrane protein YdjX (TVP38/TMEM64 family)
MRSASWRAAAALAALLVLIAATVWSYSTDGLIHRLFSPADGTTRLETLRTFVLGWGALAPLVYTAIVVLEVLVAPFPGALLYAPGGALFGGFVGGTLSLIGNTIGAGIAGWIGAAFGQGWLARRLEGSRLDALRRRLETRGGWVVFLLRLNPLTSSDLVSYAAGLAGVRPLRVALGTLAGMGPQCYVQAYLAATIFEVMPDWFVGLFAGVLLAVAAVVVWMLLRRRTDETKLA